MATVNRTIATAWWMAASEIGTTSNSVAMPSATCRTAVCNSAFTPLPMRGASGAERACHHDRDAGQCERDRTDDAGLGSLTQ